MIKYIDQYGHITDITNAKYIVKLQGTYKKCSLTNGWWYEIEEEEGIPFKKIYSKEKLDDI
jgi:hypothetical protein